MKKRRLRWDIRWLLLVVVLLSGCARSRSPSLSQDTRELLRTSEAGLATMYQQLTEVGAPPTFITGIAMRSGRSSFIATSTPRRPTRPNPTRTPRPTLNTQPTAISTASAGGIDSSLDNDEGDSIVVEPNAGVIFSIDNYLDVPSFRSVVAGLGGYYLIGLLVIFVLLFLLNEFARMMVNRSQNMVVNRQKQRSASVLLQLYGIIHWFAILAFYLGSVLWIVAFAAVIMGAFTRVTLDIIPLIFAILGIASGIFVISGVVRGLRAAYLSAGESFYLLFRDEAPELFTFLDGLADELGAPRIQEIRLVPETRLEMTWRGNLLSLPWRHSTPILILGMATLQRLSEAQFRAFIVHQYSLFGVGRRGIGSASQIIRGRMGITQAVDHLLGMGFDNPLNYVWYSFKIFQVIYAEVTSHAVRLYILLVDSQVAEQSPQLVEGMEQVDFVKELFDIHRQAEIERAITDRIPLLNIYTNLFDDETRIDRALSKLRSTQLQSPPDQLHLPPPILRYSAMSHQPIGVELPPESPVLGWFTDADGLMVKMTILVQRAITTKQYQLYRLRAPHRSSR